MMVRGFCSNVVATLHFTGASQFSCFSDIMIDRVCVTSPVMHKIECIYFNCKLTSNYDGAIIYIKV